LKRSVEVDLIQSGQPRPYADHIYEGYLTFSVPDGQAWDSKFPNTKDTVAQYAKLMVHHWDDELPDDPMERWFAAKLDKLEQVSEVPNKWHVIVRVPFTD
jgi:hypothetical protein